MTAQFFTDADLCAKQQVLGLTDAARSNSRRWRITPDSARYVQRLAAGAALRHTCIPSRWGYAHSRAVSDTNIYTHIHSLRSAGSAVISHVRKTSQGGARVGTQHRNGC